MKKVINKFIHNPFFALGIFLLSIAFLYSLFVKKPQIPIPISTDTNNLTICTRKEMYTMPPEFVRAISLIEQRSVHSDYRLMDKCLDVQYGDTGDSEGIFYFDSEASSLEHYIIKVNESYKQVDDLLTAILLSHELQHAEQYYMKVHDNKSFGCVWNEVSAFFWQFQFVRSLNLEERKSLSARMNTYSGTQMHVQIRILEDLLVFHNQANQSCSSQKYPNEDDQWSCYVKEFRGKLQNWVESNPAYKKQCGL
ncbi:MAG: hypothetical protein WAV30_03875 [Microgenomates group bacterium]